MFERLLALLKLDDASKDRRYVANYVRALPKCTSRIVIGGSPYDATHYKCEIETTPAELFQYVKTEVGKRAAPSNQHQILLAYLQKVNLANPQATHLPPDLIQYIIDAEAIIGDGLARVKCGQCGKTFPSIRIDSINKTQRGNRITWTQLWECPDGHAIYREDLMLRIIPSRKQ